MSQVARLVGTYSGFCSITRSISYGMLVHRMVTCTSILNLPVLIYPPEWQEAVTVKCLAQEHNIMFPARARGQTAQNRKEIQKSNNRLFIQTAYKFKNG